MRAWHHSHVLALIRESDPAETLRELLLQCQAVTMAIQDGQPWKGTASELEGLLRAGARTRDVARGLLTYSKACGEYLGRLALSDGCEISRKRINGMSRWSAYTGRAADRLFSSLTWSVKCHTS